MSVGWDNYLDEKVRRENTEAEVERLRAEVESCQGPQWYKAWKDSEAEVERLRVEHGKARNEDAIILTDYRNASHAAIARAERAEAALREIVRVLAPFDGSPAIPYQQLLDIARAALAGEVKT